MYAHSPIFPCCYSELYRECIDELKCLWPVPHRRKIQQMVEVFVAWKVSDCCCFLLTYGREIILIAYLRIAHPTCPPLFHKGVFHRHQQFPRCIDICEILPLLSAHAVNTQSFFASLVTMNSTITGERFQITITNCE